MADGASSGARQAVHGFPPELTSFVGRSGEAAKVAGLLAEYRLVTVTGPGGVGKTRLAGEVARQIAGRFADRAWLVELAAVAEPALVPAAVARALGIRQPAGMSLLEALTAVLARQQLLLVLDNCEHVLAAAAGLCATLLAAADDVRILATSREPVGVAGEARYRLGPLGVPAADDPAGTSGSEAVALFADRARLADPHFILDAASGPVVAQIVARLDGMPLAIELAAAQAEALGLAQLLDRLDDRLVLFMGADRRAPDRQRSLAATVEWSYRLLSEPEQKAFRALSVFPGWFTLDAAEAVTGPGAGPVVLRLVGCSLLSPPRPGEDGRARYLMLETLRAYGAVLLAQAGEQDQAAAALAAYALGVAERAAAGLETSAGEVDAGRWLDAEDATVHHVLAWARAHDPKTALRLAVALAPWWWQRGRWAFGYELLGAVAGHADKDGDEWCTAQYWLGLLGFGFGQTVSLGHATAARDGLAGRFPSPLLCLALIFRAGCLANLGRIAEADAELRRTLVLARQIRHAAGEAGALILLAHETYYSGDPESALAWLRQAQRIDAAGIPGWISREGDGVLRWALIEAGELAAAERLCVTGLDKARQVGAPYSECDCLMGLAWVDLLAGRLPEAGARLREATEIAARLGDNLVLLTACLDLCGHLCARAQRPADAVAAWAAFAACEQRGEFRDEPHEARRRAEPLRKVRQALGPARTQEAEERGAAIAMSLATAAEYALLLAAGDSRDPKPAPGLPRLSPREQQLVTLVARGSTDAQIAAQLYISVRTVRSHLDRIRDKTGCRRRADLTRLALQASLV